MSVPYSIDAATNEVGTNISEAAKQLRALKDQGVTHQYIDHAITHLEAAGKANQTVYDVCKAAFANHVNVKQDAGMPVYDPDAANPQLHVKAPDLAPLTGPALDAMRRLQHGQAGDGGQAEVVALLRARGDLSEATIHEYITQYGPEGQLRRYIDGNAQSADLGAGVEVAGLSPLTGEALHDALVGKSGGDRYLVGGFDAELSRAYVNAYGVGGEHYNPSYSQLAQLTTQQLADLQASYPTPRDWLAQHGANVETIAATWPEALALAGRA
jgi:hypothetical protein